MSEMNVGLSEALSGHLREEDKPDSLLFRKADCAGECMQNEASSELIASHGCSRGIGFDFDLNVPHATRLNEDDNSNSMEMSECGSTTNGALEEKHQMNVWKEMKQNSFTSFEYNSLPPPVPKRRGRKTKSEMLQKKLEMAKKERVDRFARIATHSGLFSELNPGIINHVRNSKQVYSIIEALVKSECIENGTKMNHGNSVSLEMPLPVSLGVKQECIDFCSSQTDSKMQYKASNFTHGGNTDNLSLKLSSSMLENDSEGVTSLSSDNNSTCVSVLTVKAATVACKWLELLHQDAKDRLTALRHSRKRARSVIQTDLPFLLAKEFSSTMSDGTRTVASKFLKNDEAELHQIRWSSLFSHMEMALSEEEKQLEGWISQVKEMKLHCERGLRNETWKSSFCTQPKLRTPGDSFRAVSTSNEKDCAVTAAAASMYSTCSFLLSKDKGSR